MYRKSNSRSSNALLYKVRDIDTIISPSVMLHGVLVSLMFEMRRKWRPLEVYPSGQCYTCTPLEHCLDWLSSYRRCALFIQWSNMDNSRWQMKLKRNEGTVPTSWTTLHSVIYGTDGWHWFVKLCTLSTIETTWCYVVNKNSR